VRTIVLSRGTAIPFQRYFVEQRCAPPVDGFRFEGAGSARPSPAFRDALADDALEAVVLCPSNPFVSIGPIFALSAVQDWLRRRAAPVVAVSPIVGGEALKGPAAKMMAELGLASSPAGLARHYGDRIDALVIDEADRAAAPELERLGLGVAVTDTIMQSPDDRARLARDVLGFAGTLRPRSR